MFNLPKDLARFTIWWLIEAPKRVFEINRRIFILVNNELSFTLYVKLLFVPLFGDYTVVGHLVGFVYRVLRIILGFITMIFFLVFWGVSLFTWYVLLPLLIYYLEFWFIPFAILIFMLWRLTAGQKPLRRVENVLDGRVLESFRPKVKEYVNELKGGRKDVLPRFFSEPDILRVLKRLELEKTDFIANISGKTLNLEGFDGKAYEDAKKQKTRYVELEHLFLALVQSIEKVDIFLASYSLDYGLCEEAVGWILEEREELSQVYFWQEDYEAPSMGGVNRGKTGRVTPELDKVSEDFTEQARKGLFRRIAGMEQKIDEVANLLGSDAYVNILIVGEPGSGKTSLVRALAQRIIKGTEFKSLKFKRIVSLNAGSLVAGTKTEGEIAERLEKIFQDVEGSGDIILFVDEIHNLIAGVTEGSDASAILSLIENRLGSSKFQFIGATNISDYRKYIEEHGSLARLFNLVDLKEASVEDTIKILKKRATDFEKASKVLITYPAITRTVELSKKLIHERVFPDKAIEVLGRTVTRDSEGDRYVTAEDISEVVSEMTHVPVTTIREDEAERLINIEEEMKKYVVGQDLAIDQVAKAMKRARAGIRDEAKPIASFLFVGTTGVGKTETAKTLARVYFGNKEAMVRLDMSEYQQADSIGRLLGASDGSSKGLLTEQVRTSPFAVVLLDEIEKANANILMTFLQVLDDGRLTDSSGKTVDFTNTIIIATSNVGTKAVQEVTEKGGGFEDIKEVAMREVRNRFTPEFLNRFTGIVVYRPLDFDTVRKIAGLMLKRISGSIEEKGVKLSFRPELIDELVRRGFSPEWGARPLARVIEDSVETYLAEKILSKEIVRGSEVVLGLEVF